MTDKKDRSEALSKRLEKDQVDTGEDSGEADSDSSKISNGSETSNTSETGKTSNTSKMSKRSKTDKTDSGSLKDRPSVLMYLPEEVHQELGIRFDEMNARYKREHGESLEKNRDFYPAVVEAGLEGKDLEDVLDL